MIMSWLRKMIRGTSNWLIFVILTIIGMALSWSVWTFDQFLITHIHHHQKPVNTGIICLSPAITEILHALTLDKKLVAIGEHCHYPPIIRNLPIAGSYLQPNLEKILFLKPQSVLIQGKNHALEHLSQATGIAMHAFDLTSIESIYYAISKLGRLYDCEPAAMVLIDQIQGDLRAIHWQTRDQHRPKTFLCLSRASSALGDMITANQTTFAGELLELAGGDNIFRTSMQPYPVPSLAALIELAPEVIIDISHHKLKPNQRERRRADWQALPMLPAVRSQRVHVIDDDYVLIPGPRVVQTARHLHKILHAQK